MSINFETEPVRIAFFDMARLGVKMRMVTEITKENLAYCKEFMKISEVRHLEGIKGNFGVTEKDYLGSAISHESIPFPRVVHCTVKPFIEQQQYFFQTLWEKAILAEQRIREIEEGVKPNVIEIIREPQKVQSLGVKLASEALEELLIVFSTANAFHRQERDDRLIPLLIEKAKNPLLKIKILTPVDDAIAKAASELETGFKNIEFRFLDSPLPFKMSVLVVDRQYSLVVELKDDKKEGSFEAIGLATYSTSTATVVSYVSIFESLWTKIDLYEELKASYQTQREFVDIAAHELRAPIQPILGLAEVLKDQMSSSQNEPAKLLVDVIIRNANRLAKLQQDLLDVARIDAHSLKLEMESFDLNEAILSTVRDLRDQARESDTELLYAPDGINHVVGDKSRLIQVISNLLSNAIRFTRQGTVRIDAKQDGSHMTVSVMDSGRGIDPEIMPKLFTKFATKSEKGTGLGLFIAKSIVEAHGGRIWAKNNSSGKGATFTFTLPLAKD